MAHLLKHVVSQDLKRLRDGTYDLDLSYILPNIVAMGFPASGVEGYFRNHITDIANYLNERHKDHFMVFNLSEREYDTKLLEGRVITMGFPDHHAPPLLLLFRILIKLNSWLNENSKNIAVVHCLAGRGRTGTIITTYLLFAGLCENINDALAFYAHQRSSKLQGVSQPSQRRSAFYADAILCHGVYPKPKRLRLLKLTFGPMPRISSKGGLRPLVYLYNYCSGTEEPLYVSETIKERATHAPLGTMVIIHFAARKEVQLVGDIVLKISHIGGLMTTKYDQVLRLIFHTGFELQRDNFQQTTDRPLNQSNGIPREPATGADDDENQYSENENEDEEEQENNANEGGEVSDTVASSSPPTAAPVESAPSANNNPITVSSTPALTTISSSPTSTADSAFPIPPTCASAVDSTTTQSNASASTTTTSVTTPTSESANGGSATDNRKEVSLVFRKGDLDIAYKDVRFQDRFFVKFDCELLDDDDEELTKAHWDEALYQEFTATHQVCLKNRAEEKKKQVKIVELQNQLAAQSTQSELQQAQAPLPTAQLATPSIGTNSKPALQPPQPRTMPLTALRPGRSARTVQTPIPQVPAQDLTKIPDKEQHQQSSPGFLEQVQSVLFQSASF